MPRSLRFLLPLLLAAAGLPARTLTLLVTTDMHGWLEPTQDGAGPAWVGGAAETLTAWRDREHLGKGGALILSCGDNYTGPAISTYFKGDSVTDAMNAMGYAASALGNHEFDFGLPKLFDLAGRSHFSYLACNLSPTAAGAPALPVAPYKIFTVQGVKVGVLGLTLLDLASVSSAPGWTGSDYAAALRRWAPKARADGAQVLVVIGHVPFRPLMQAAEAVKDLGIPVFFGGHSHENTLGQAPSGAWVVNAGCWWRSYARVDLDYDADLGRARVLAADLVPVRGPPAYGRTQALLNLSFWQRHLAAVAGPVLGYSRTGLERHWALSNWVTDAWLEADPKADVALCNFHGLRQDLPAGPINNLQLLSVMPFENRLVAVAMSGADLLKLLPPPGSGFLRQSGEVLTPGGLREQGQAWVLDRNDQPVNPSVQYRVLVNDFIADRLPLLKGRPQSVVAESWRDPLLRYLKRHPTDEDRPLETLVDAAPRQAD